jgi:homoserine dehydrogenase
VLVEGAFAEKQTFIGKGAGSYPTGSAVLSDISALTYDYRYEYKKVHQSAASPDDKLSFSNDASVEVIASFSNGEVSAKDFISATSGYRSGNKEYIRGEVELGQMARWANVEGISVLLAPHAKIASLEEEKVLVAKSA